MGSARIRSGAVQQQRRDAKVKRLCEARTWRAPASAGRDPTGSVRGRLLLSEKSGSRATRAPRGLVGGRAAGGGRVGGGHGRGDGAIAAEDVGARIRAAHRGEAGGAERAPAARALLVGELAAGEHELVVGGDRVERAELQLLLLEGVLELAARELHELSLAGGIGLSGGGGLGRPGGGEQGPELVVAVAGQLGLELRIVDELLCVEERVAAGRGHRGPILAAHQRLERLALADEPQKLGGVLHDLR